MLFKDLHTNGLHGACGGHWQKQGVPLVGFHARTPLALHSTDTPALEHIFHSWQYVEEYLAVGTKFLLIPDPTRFSLRNHRVAGNPKQWVLPDISGKPEVSGTTRYFR